MILHKISTNIKSGQFTIQLFGSQCLLYLQHGRHMIAMCPADHLKNYLDLLFDCFNHKYLSKQFPKPNVNFITDHNKLIINLIQENFEISKQDLIDFQDIIDKSKYITDLFDILE